MNRELYPYYIVPSYHRSKKVFEKYTTVSSEFNVDKPILVEVESEGEGWLITMVICIGLLLLGLALMDSGGIVFVTPGFWGALISYWLYKWRKKKQSEKENSEIKAYNRLVENYNEQYKSFKEEEKELKRLARIFRCETEEDRKSAINYLIANNNVYYMDTGYYEDVMKGRSENKFYEYLKMQFGDRILIDKCVKENYGREFYPDFIYCDKENGLMIDIEVDEPYSYKDKTPIHYIGANEDRDDFFESSYWGVIRFSENQVVSNPISCLVFIRRFIDSIYTDNAVPDWHNQYEKRWTRDEANILISRNYRTASKKMKQEITREITANYEFKHLLLSNESPIIDFARYYHSLGLNVTCIHSTENRYNKVVKDKLKHPCHFYKFLGKDHRQLFGEMLEYNWSPAVGLGTVTGFNNLVILDIDESRSLKLVKIILGLLDLPANYQWVTESGSGNGYHVYIRTTRPEKLDKIYAVSTYEPNESYGDHFGKIEILWHTHIVMPPSLHKSGGKYKFLKEIPSDKVKSVPIQSVLKCIERIADISTVKHGKEYKEEVEEISPNNPPAAPLVRPMQSPEENQDPGS